MAQGLVIEDDPASATLAAQTLESLGLSVSIETNGDDGLRRATEQSFAVILLDIRLPGHNGYEVCRILRERGVDTPILVLSAKLGEYDEVEAFEFGADDYLRKPYSVPVLAARVQSLIRRKQPLGLASSYAGITYNSETGQATVSDTTVSLTPREGQVLVELLAARGSPASKLRLLERVWGEDFDGSPNVVDVYIRYLRLKLGSDRIETLSRIGYRLREPDSDADPT